jgi:HEAT repeat protein
VEPLIKRLEDKQEPVRKDASYAIAEIVKQRKVDISAAEKPLRTRLDDTDPIVQSIAAWALGHMAYNEKDFYR